MAKVIPFQTRVGAADTGATSSGLSRQRCGSYNRRSMSSHIEESLQKGASFLIGDWVVEPSLNRLTRAGVSIQLELRAVDVLLCLVAHAGEVVPKDVLLDTVWQTEFVSDNTLANRIAELRSAFGDDAHEPRYIETIRKRGYRLIAEVGPLTAEDEAATDVPEAIPPEDEERNPYPGLAAFTEADAEDFFGREAEAAALWRKITSRRLLAVIGPSGVGKSSLLRAGVAPRAPPGWRVVVFTPGEAPALSLARALAPDHAGDPAAMARLLGFSDADTVLAVVARWRGMFDEAVLVVDQFEELFTLNPPEVQASFIALLRRLVDAADIHLVLAMRDDYLYRCQDFDEIAPIFRELTPLPTPKPEGLRRALKEPAARKLYRFENELLVDRIVAEVDGERGALPMMAFAVHRLWEERDRERRELTEAAYERIGGVAGALARHADATLERIGPERRPIVRELFRNLVTSEGTRAIREVDELLEVFERSALPPVAGEKVRRSALPPVASKTLGVRRLTSHSERSERSLSDSSNHRDAAKEVLDQLIDARLLTGYRENHDERPVHRVEIVHESLLTSWPRLVRWRTQDADSVRLRDELRQSAHLWNDHGRTSDYLWAGKAFREFSVWREDYPGGLTAVEEDFASAMTSHATRSRRRRRITVAVIFAVLLAVLGIVAASRQQAVAEARRAEAARLLALGQLRLEDYPTATLAHAIASLELADTPEARRLALRALWEGPTAFVVNEDQTRDVKFAASGDLLFQAIQASVEHHLRVVTRDGSSRLLEHAHDTDEMVNIGLNPEGTMMFSESMVPSESPQHLVLWSLPKGARIGDFRFPPGSKLMFGSASWRPSGLVIGVWRADQRDVVILDLDGTSDRLTTVARHVAGTTFVATMACDHLGRQWLALAEDDAVSVYRFSDGGVSEPRHLRRSGHRVRSIAFDAEGRFLAAAYFDGQIRLWDPESAAVVESFEGLPGVIRIRVLGDPLRVVADASDGEILTTRIWSVGDDGVRLLRTIESLHRGTYPGVDAFCWTWDRGRRLLAKSGPDNVTRVWGLERPADADPLVLKRGDVGYSLNHAFSPGSDWLATGDGSGLAVWPLGRQYPSILSVHDQPVLSVAFGPRGAWLASGDSNGTVNLTPLEGDVPPPGHVVYRGEHLVSSLAVTSDGARLLATSEVTDPATMIPLDGGPPSSLTGLVFGHDGAFSPNGRLAVVAGIGLDSVPRLYLIRADTAEPVADIELECGAQGSVKFEDNGRILSCGSSGVFRTDPSTGKSELLFDGICGRFAASSDSRFIALVETDVAWSFATSGRVVVVDLDAGTERNLERHGDEVWSVAIDPTGAIVATGDRDGVLRVGPASGDEPHMLLGHEGRIRDVEIDPLGRWIATGGEDGTVRIWPMPDLSKPPLHTPPHDELMAKLKSLTNLRVVRDQESETGWTLTHDPFPGWETVPSW